MNKFSGSPSRSGTGLRALRVAVLRMDELRDKPHEDDHADELDERLGDDHDRGEVERVGQCQCQEADSLCVIARVMSLVLGTIVL